MRARRKITLLYDQYPDDADLADALLSEAQAVLESVHEADDTGSRIRRTRAAARLLKEAEYVLTKDEQARSL